jgi:hypothetical protein
MQVVELQARPIDKWPREYTKNRKRSQFKAPYGDTMRLLDQELRHLGAKGVVLLMALREQDIRLDGRPKANTSASHPGVILSFETKNGPMRFPCDKFDRWDDNLRAIALSLEALRKMDRYGVTASGEQYTGWKALPPPASGIHTVSTARATIESVSGKVDWANATTAAAAIRTAIIATHPDSGGDAEKFKAVAAAAKVIQEARP